MGSLAPLLATGWGAVVFVTLAAATLPSWPGVLDAVAALPSLVRPVAPSAFAAHWGRVLLAAAAAGLAVVAAAGLGGVLVRFAARRTPSRDAAGFAGRALAGLAAAATLGLALGLAGLLFPAVTSAAALALALAGFAAGPRCPRPAVPRGAARGAFLAAAVLVTAWGLLAVPPQTWVDTLGYHLGAPALWERLHRVTRVPDYHFQLPLLFEHLVSLTRGLVHPAALNLGVLVLLALLLAGWAGGRFGPAAGWLAVAGWLASSQTAFLAAHVKHDLLAAAYLLLAVAVWDSGWGSFACGAALGWTFAVKYTSAAPGIAILVWEALRPGRRPARLAALVLGSLAATAPFLLTAWLQTGNPVFPAVFPGLGWENAQRVALGLVGCPGRDLDLSDPASLPRTIVRLGTEMLPLAWAGIPLLLWAAAPAARRTLAAAATGLVVWALFIPCLRFMVPAFPLLAALGAAGLVTFARGGRGRRALAVALTAVALLLGTVQGLASADFGRRSMAAALGLESSDAFLARTLTTLRAAALASAILPPAGRVLLLGDSRSEPFNRGRMTIPQDILDDPLPLVFARESRDAAGIAKRFRQLGITAVVLNGVTSEYRGQITQMAFPWPPAALGRYREFWGRWAEPLPVTGPGDAENGGFVFYRIRREPGPPAAALQFLPGAEGLGLDVRSEGPAATARRLAAVLQFAPGVAQLQSRLWAALLGTREYREAETWIRNGLSLGFRSADVWASLGAALRGQGRYGEAAGAFRRAQALDPGRPVYARLAAECEAQPAQHR